MHRFSFSALNKRKKTTNPVATSARPLHPMSFRSSPDCPSLKPTPTWACGPADHQGGLHTNADGRATHRFIGSSALIEHIKQTLISQSDRVPLFVCLFFLFVCLLVGWLVGWFVGLVWVFESVTIVSLFLLLLQNWVSLGVTPISSSLDVSVLNSHDNGIPRRLRVSPSAVYNHPPPHPPPVFVPSPPSSSSFPSTVQQRTPSVVSSTNTFVTFFLKIPIFLSFFLFLSIYLSIHPSISLYLYLSLSLIHAEDLKKRHLLVGFLFPDSFRIQTQENEKKRWQLRSKTKIHSSRPGFDHAKLGEEKWKTMKLYWGMVRNRWKLFQSCANKRSFRLTNWWASHQSFLTANRSHLKQLLSKINGRGINYRVDLKAISQLESQLEIIS